MTQNAETTNLNTTGSEKDRVTVQKMSDTFYAEQKVQAEAFLNMALGEVRKTPTGCDIFISDVYAEQYGAPQKLHEAIIMAAHDAAPEETRFGYIVADLKAGDSVDTAFLVRAMTALQAAPDKLDTFLHEAWLEGKGITYPDTAEAVLRGFVEEGMGKPRDYLVRRRSSIFLMRAKSALMENIDQFDFLVWSAFNSDYNEPKKLHDKLIEYAKNSGGPKRAADFMQPASAITKGETVDEIFLGRARQIIMADPLRVDDLVEEAFRKELPLAPLTTASLKRFSADVRETMEK